MYDIQQKQMIKCNANIDVIMPDLIEFSCVAVKNDNYVIIVGGATEFAYCFGYDDIYILDLKNMKCIKSKIKCPEKSQFKVIWMGSDEYDLLCSGYLKMHCVDIPSDIMGLLILFHGRHEGYIHLFLTNALNHWKIALSVIFNNVESNQVL